MNKIYVITAAGGNATAIELLDSPKEREWYEATGSKLINQFPELDVEQVGFLIPALNHFEMAGGELCGNGSRSAGLLLARMRAQDELAFTTSGHDGPVEISVKDRDGKRPFVSAAFTSLSASVKPSELSGYENVSVVDLGGIVHVLIPAPMPKGKEAYEAEHKRITRELGLQERDAVGVDWYTEGLDQVAMHPVVWVRSIDTYFYETSCGSGSIATSATTGITDILQPSGETIDVSFGDRGAVIASKMEIIKDV